MKVFFLPFLMDWDIMALLASWQVEFLYELVSGTLRTLLKLYKFEELEEFLRKILRLLKSFMEAFD